MKLISVSESIKSAQSKRTDETRVTKTWERADRIRQSIGDDEFIQNMLIKMSDDDMNDILDSIEQDMNA